MPNRSSKGKKDVNEIAKSIVDQVADDVEPKEEPAEPEKNPAAVALGRLGGKKGGPARAKKLSKERRSEIARRAAKKEVGEGLAVVRFFCLVVNLDQSKFDNSFGDVVYVFTAALFSDSSDNEQDANLDEHVTTS